MTINFNNHELQRLIYKLFVSKKWEPLFITCEMSITRRVASEQIFGEAREFGKVKLFPESFRGFYPPRRATRRQGALIRISINRQRNGARIDHFVSVFWKRPGGRNRLLAQTLAHKNFKLVLVCQPGRVISIDCEDNVPFWKLSPPNRSSSLENPPSQPNSKPIEIPSKTSSNIFRLFDLYSVAFFHSRIEEYVRIVFNHTDVYFEYN